MLRAMLTLACQWKYREQTRCTCSQASVHIHSIKVAQTLLWMSVLIVKASPFATW